MESLVSGLDLWLPDWIFGCRVRSLAGSLFAVLDH